MASRIFLLFAVVLFTSCREDSRENPRFYTEGKISGNVDLNRFSLTLFHDNRIAAETLLSANKAFRLSGPVGKGEVRLTATEKIGGFSPAVSGLRLTEDSLSIIFPVGMTYVKFDEIKIK